MRLGISILVGWTVMTLAWIAGFNFDRRDSTALAVAVMTLAAAACARSA